MGDDRSLKSKMSDNNERQLDQIMEANLKDDDESDFEKRAQLFNDKDSSVNRLSDFVKSRKLPTISVDQDPNSYSVKDGNRYLNQHFDDYKDGPTFGNVPRNDSSAGMRRLDNLMKDNSLKNYMPEGKLTEPHSGAKLSS